MTDILEKTLKMLDREEASIKASYKLNCDIDKVLESNALNYLILSFESRVATWKFATGLSLLCLLFSLFCNVVAFLKLFI